MRRRDAFTFTELLATLLVIGIAGGAIVSFMDSSMTAQSEGVSHAMNQQALRQPMMYVNSLAFQADTLEIVGDVDALEDIAEEESEKGGKLYYIFAAKSGGSVGENDIYKGSGTMRDMSLYIRGADGDRELEGLPHIKQVRFDRGRLKDEADVEEGPDYVSDPMSADDKQPDAIKMTLMAQNRAGSTGEKDLTWATALRAYAGNAGILTGDLESGAILKVFVRSLDSSDNDNGGDVVPLDMVAFIGAKRGGATQLIDKDDDGAPLGGGTRTLDISKTAGVVGFVEIPRAPGEDDDAYFKRAAGTEADFEWRFFPSLQALADQKYDDYRAELVRNGTLSIPEGQPQPGQVKHYQVLDPVTGLPAQGAVPGELAADHDLHDEFPKAPSTVIGRTDDGVASAYLPLNQSMKGGFILFAARSKGAMEWEWKESDYYQIDEVDTRSLLAKDTMFDVAMTVAEGRAQWHGSSSLFPTTGYAKNASRYGESAKYRDGDGRTWGNGDGYSPIWSSPTYANVRPGYIKGLEVEPSAANGDRTSEPRSVLVERIEGMGDILRLVGDTTRGHVNSETSRGPTDQMLRKRLEEKYFGKVKTGDVWERDPEFCIENYTLWIDAMVEDTSPAALAKKLDDLTPAGQARARSSFVQWFDNTKGLAVNLNSAPYDASGNASVAPAHAYSFLFAPGMADNLGNGGLVNHGGRQIPGGRGVYSSGWYELYHDEMPEALTDWHHAEIDGWKDWKKTDTSAEPVYESTDGLWRLKMKMSEHLRSPGIGPDELTKRRTWTKDYTYPAVAHATGVGSQYPTGLPGLGKLEVKAWDEDHVDPAKISKTTYPLISPNLDDLFDRATLGDDDDDNENVVRLFNRFFYSRALGRELRGSPNSWSSAYPDAGSLGVQVRQGGWKPWWVLSYWLTNNWSGGPVNRYGSWAGSEGELVTMAPPVGYADATGGVSQSRRWNARKNEHGHDIVEHATFDGYRIHFGTDVEKEKGKEFPNQDGKNYTMLRMWPPYAEWVRGNGTIANWKLDERFPTAFEEEPDGKGCINVKRHWDPHDISDWEVFIPLFGSKKLRYVQALRLTSAVDWTAGGVANWDSTGRYYTAPETSANAWRPGKGVFDSFVSKKNEFGGWGLGRQYLWADLAHKDPKAQTEARPSAAAMASSSERTKLFTEFKGSTGFGIEADGKTTSAMRGADRKGTQGRYTMEITVLTVVKKRSPHSDGWRWQELPPAPDNMVMRVRVYDKPRIWDADKREYYFPVGTKRSREIWFGLDDDSKDMWWLLPSERAVSTGSLGSGRQRGDAAFKLMKMAARDPKVATGTGEGVEETFRSSNQGRDFIGSYLDFYTWQSEIAMVTIYDMDIARGFPLDTTLPSGNTVRSHMMNGAWSKNTEETARSHVGSDPWPRKGGGAAKNFLDLVRFEDSL